jgi:outer membrane protein OmpA-like peptidoglycan-associated protein
MKPFLFIIAILFASLTLHAQQTATIVIHFDFNKSDIRPASASTLDSFFTAERTAKLTGIELYGHCDHIGDYEYNDALSIMRVLQTKNYLLGKGIAENVFGKDEGFGKRQPLNENRTPEERLQNRRVEIVVHWQDSMKVNQPPPVKNPPVSLTEIIKDTATKAGRNIILRNLQFQGGRHFLLPQSQPVLDELYRVLTDNPTLVIEIQGHVCCTPDNEDGLDVDLRSSDLSYQRAKAIYGHLVARGIAAERLSYTGFGGSKKLFPLERDESERQENRRVELKIVRR